MDLRDDFCAALDAGALSHALPEGADQPLFERLFAVRGEVRRQTAKRRTLRLVGKDGSAYFAKLHDGVGWREILKNLLLGQAPVLGARNEYAACRVLAASGVAAPTVAAFGEHGGNPATRRSFVICDALEGRVSLEDLGRSWALEPPSPALRRRLIVAVAELARAMHNGGLEHRDFYLAHLLADAGKLRAGEVALAVIDLHRARLRSPLPLRRRRRDLAALLYSVNASGLGPTPRERHRFVVAYAKSGPAALRRGGFWIRVAARAERLRERALANGIAQGARACEDDVGEVASVGRFADLGRTPPLPFRVDLDFGEGGRRFVCTATLRSQPGRRFVARTTVDGQDAVLKAFFGRRATRDFERERRGIAALKAAGIAAPALLATGRGGGALVLAFAFVAGRPPTANDANAVLSLLARMHERGLRQSDLHLGNFIVRDDHALPVDSGSIRRSRWVTNRQRLEDAARLLAQFAPGDAPDAAAAAAAYARASKSAGAIDPQRLAPRATRMRYKRVRQLMAKSVRNCTAFAVVRQRGRFLVAGRDDHDPALRAMVADPERALAGGTILKQGNTASVVRVGALAVKRYSAKGALHRLRLRVAPSRARRAWQAGHGLRLLGIATPRPRALIECRGGGAAAYLVLDFEGEATLGAETRAPLSPQRAAAASALFERWREAGFSHGDTKATNFIARGGDLVALDLDAATFHRWRWRFERAHRRDRARWLRNWPAARVAEVEG